MRRRDLIAFLGSVAAAGPVVARAQTTAPKRIGVLMFGTDKSTSALLVAFTTGLRSLGLEEGKTVILDVRWPGNDFQRIHQEAQALVATAPDVILAGASLMLAAARQATLAIPIVFANVTDPVGQGFVQSLAHPGGNATGFLNYEPAIASKWLNLLKEVAPDVTRVGVLYNPDIAPQARLFLDALKAAAPSLSMSIIPAPVRDDADIEREATSMAAQQKSGLLMLADAFFGLDMSQTAQVIASAARHRLPTVYPYPDYAKLGGLIGYGVDVPDLFRRAADYVDRILKGEKPGNLPVQEPTKFALKINLKTAQTLGLMVPQRLIYTADEVIE